MPSSSSPNQRNGDAQIGVDHHRSFQSTVSIQKLRRVNVLLLSLRFLAFCFSLTSAIFMFTTPNSAWLNSDPFRILFAANAVVAVYSFFETSASVWEVLKGSTLLPEPFQLWFDFAHDQVFAYLLVAAEAAGMGEAVRKGKGDTCTVDSGFCVQVYVSIALGFVGFVFLSISALVSAFRVVCFLVTGSRSPHLF